jgi:hypothetical protein
MESVSVLSISTYRHYQCSLSLSLIAIAKTRSEHGTSSDIARRECNKPLNKSPDGVMKNKCLSFR